MARALAAVLALAILGGAPAAAEGPADWRREFPKTDFDRRSIDLGEIVADGNVRDSIPTVGVPTFIRAGDNTELGPWEPVLSIGINGDFRAYPLRILLWHEIVNDLVGGVPVLISYCPLCNSGVVFDRRLGHRILEFGNTGRIRHYDMIMYDKATESWWQQFLGEAIVGELTGARLRMLPARLESLEKFVNRAPDGKLLVPEAGSDRPYGVTPYANLEHAEVPRANFPYDLPDGMHPLERVVVVGAEAWTLALVRARGKIERDDLVLTWEQGQNSIHDNKVIALGRDVGNVVVRRRAGNGFADVPYDVSFAFAFAAFRPGGVIYQE